MSADVDREAWWGTTLMPLMEPLQRLAVDAGGHEAWGVVAAALFRSLAALVGRLNAVDWPAWSPMFAHATAKATRCYVVDDANLCVRATSFTIAMVVAFPETVEHWRELFDQLGAAMVPVEDQYEALKAHAGRRDLDDDSVDDDDDDDDNSEDDDDADDDELLGLAARLSSIGAIRCFLVASAIQREQGEAKRLPVSAELEDVADEVLGQAIDKLIVRTTWSSSLL